MLTDTNEESRANGMKIVSFILMSLNNDILSQNEGIFHVFAYLNNFNFYLFCSQLHFRIFHQSIERQSICD